MTRTYVRYFGEDQVAPINDVLSKITDEWGKRRLHVSSENREEGDDRLMMAALAVKRLMDRVPE